MTKKTSAKKSTVKPVPIHDAPDLPFRRAPLATATRSVVIPLSPANVAFDAELLRTSVAWQGSSLNLFGPPYHGSSDRFICDFDGPSLWTTPQLFPWSLTPMADVVARDLPEGTRFRGVSTRGQSGKTVLMYDVNLKGMSTPVRVHEIPYVRDTGKGVAIVRRFEIGPCDKDLFVLLQAEQGNFLVGQPSFSPVIERSAKKDLLLVFANDQLVATNQEVAYSEIRHVEKDGRGPVLEVKTIKVSRTEARVYLKIPAHAKTAHSEVATVVFSNKADLPVLGLVLGNGAVVFPDMNAVTNRTTTPVTFSAKVMTAEKTFFPRLDGDKSYKVEHFPLPKEADMRVTGMDFLPNGDLAVCTWAGEVYFVHNAQADVRNATYQRFARGLMEPMGVKVIDGQIYVMQKCELTRLTDTDGNGEADFFETINSSWDFTGRYNDFAFGPELDRTGNFCVFMGGNGGYWDARYMGWAARFSRDGNNFAPFCSGLRVPNGFAALGRDRDLFVTDNQGNWIGACKLNHLQEGKFYGYPSAWPAPKEKYEKTNTFTPPAIWFPYTLAKSASGITVIEDDKFGPFKGQMLVGDFQLSVLTRVALEKVNGEWQGAVWPFAKGFLSGVNRVTMGPDGKAYVGGGKGAHWAGAVGPQFYSLDRVSYTGKVPFEVKEVHARPDGLELTFTQPVDAEAAKKPESYDVGQYNYLYHSTYGSPEIDFDGKENSFSEIKVASAAVSEDRTKVKLTLEGWRAGYVTMVRSLDVVNEDGESLRHNTFWYTLNQIPKS